MEKINNLETIRHHYKVRSSGGEKCYYVGQLKSSGKWICQCEHFLFRILPEISEKPCRHVLSVQGALKKKRATNG
jgi:hypothetical protein